MTESSTLTKTCTKCGVEKPLDDFNRKSTSRLRAQCRVCTNRQVAVYCAAHPEKVAARQRKYRADNREKVTARQRAYHANNKEKIACAHLRSNRKTKYGLDQQQYDALFDEQDGRCAICGDAFEDSTPHVDHCHESKQVRGLLCRLCNTGIGHLRDNPIITASATAYLTQNREG